MTFAGPIEPRERSFAQAWFAAAMVRVGALLIGALLLSACSGLPRNPARTESVALADGSRSTLAQTAQRSLDDPLLPGFALLPVASAAFQARLELAARAEHTLDVQYFVLERDATGMHLLRALRDAAAKGVRVRLLVDDLHTTDSEELLLALSAYPNTEVRLFNPVANGRWAFAARVLGSVFEWRRFNRRMHNKLFVADNALAVLGGRNIGDAYFMRGNDNNFVDIDMLAAGKVVGELSQGFDSYWNSSLAYSVASIVTTPLSGQALRARFEELTCCLAELPADTTVPKRLQRYAAVPGELANGRLSLIQAPARVLVDPIEKATGVARQSRPPGVRTTLIEVFGQTRAEVFVISPYFIPGDIGVQRMRSLAERGVQLRLLTNSLASTDEPLVHIGYATYRMAMLRAGVEIYELSPRLARERSRLGRFARSNGSLHAKVAVLDRARIFIGSMNFDPRSEHVNTELGVLIDSPELAAEFLQMIDFRDSAYRLRLTEDRLGIEWVNGEGADAVVLATEPESSRWLRFKLWLLSPFIPEDDL